jgi:hypothetical protein
MIIKDYKKHPQISEIFVFVFSLELIPVQQPSIPIIAACLSLCTPESHQTIKENRIEFIHYLSHMAFLPAVVAGDFGGSVRSLQASGTERRRKRGRRSSALLSESGRAVSLPRAPLL